MGAGHACAGTHTNFFPLHPVVNNRFPMTLETARGDKEFPGGIGQEAFIFLQSKQVSNFYHCLVDYLPSIFDIQLKYPDAHISLEFDQPEKKLVLLRTIIGHLFGSNITINSSLDTHGKVKIEYESIKSSINERFVEYARKIRTVRDGSVKNILMKRANRYIDSELVAFLKEENFQEMQLEDFSLKEQADLIFNADHVIAPHGAGLANMIFASRATKIMELNNGFNVNCFKKLSRFCEGSYQVALCANDG